MENARLLGVPFVKRDHCTALWAVQHPSMAPTSFLVGWGEYVPEIESQRAGASF